MNEPKKELLLIFTRNIVLGKCKTRLAKTVGPEIALEIYRFLVKHTAKISRGIEVDRWVFYSDEVEENDLFDNRAYFKFRQEGDDLGARMHNAFTAGFEAGYTNIIIIGSDIYDLETADLQTAFVSLENHDFVIGPAKDGGYYLLGMKAPLKDLFINKYWGSDTVLEKTLEDLKGENIELLDTRNDVDVYEDIETAAVFQTFLKDIKE